MKKKSLFALLLSAAVLAAAAPLSAQDGYMFGAPRLSLTLRGGAAGATANADVFDFMTDQLTLSRGDFTSPAFGADLGIRIMPQVDLMLSVATAQSSNDSRFRDFVETNDEEIRQTTQLTRTPLTAGLKIHLLPRGRSISKYAFVPNRFSPYVGAAAGVMWWELYQDGDFVDFETLDIFHSFFESDGATFTANASAGGDLWVTSRVGLNVEGRYNLARADLDDDFSDFGKIDLSGWQLTAGITVRY